MSQTPATEINSEGDFRSDPWFLTELHSCVGQRWRAELFDPEAFILLSNVPRPRERFITSVRNFHALEMVRMMGFSLAGVAVVAAALMSVVAAQNYSEVKPVTSMDCGSFHTVVMIKDNSVNMVKDWGANGKGQVRHNPQDGRSWSLPSVQVHFPIRGTALPIL